MSETVTIKKLLSKSNLGGVLHEIVGSMDTQISILDLGGNLLWGDGAETPAGQYPVSLQGETIGWVVGSEKAGTVAKLLAHLAAKELDKKTLAAEVLDKYREITLLYNISEKIIASLDLKEVAQLVLEEARKFVKATSGAVLLIRDGNSVGENIFSFGEEWEADTNSEQTWYGWEGIVSTVVSTGKGEIVNDVTADPRVGTEGVWFQSLLCVPLKTREVVVGAIALGSSKPVTYMAEQLKLSSTLASQAASAIDALVHENKLRESRREALLFRLASQIRLSLDLKTILATAVTEIRTLLGLDRCLFMWDRSPTMDSNPNHRFQPRGLMPHYPYWEVVQEAKHPSLPRARQWYAVPALGSLSAQMRQLEIVRIDNVEDAKERVMRQFVLSLKCRSLLVIPIQTRGGEIGAVACGCTGVRVWSADEVELLQAVGTQLAIAINQAELYQQSCQATATAKARSQELQQALLDLQKTEAQLVQSEKMSSLGMLVAGVAHEINNPLGFISSNLVHTASYIQDLIQVVDAYQQEYPQASAEIEKLIEETELEFLKEDLPQMLSSMQMGADRIRQIVLTLRVFSRTDGTEMKPANLHEGIDSTLVLLQDRLKSRTDRPSIQVIKQYGAIPQIDCYAGQLNQVFMNLIANGIDAIEEAIDKSLPVMAGRVPTIIISTQISADGQFVSIRIADNGPGMSEEVRRKLFDPFFTTKPPGKGTGLGLSISYQIITEKHSGTLDCISTPGRGAEFIIQLPVRSQLAMNSPAENKITPRSIHELPLLRPQNQ
ncbi:MAG TPA: GAF domain-containing sensor histidine kinase [Oscillatoriaceae cyanobacterium M33_DOE_052]|uniref:histidine kinase n=1 Tax=Planktothricoides sp. SpSt-374 TaxID=2282167 RepID=A0A7C3ZWE8_9CYAN|nr:GAF domain-containing sensor histidine kinase [Oscillatoriaceae cyanobacterium M33_DOE_052]